MAKGFIGGVKGKATTFWNSADRDYVVAAGAAVISSYMVTPKINTYIDSFTNNIRYTGVIDLVIGGSLILLSMKASDGWAALGVGVAFSFLVEGAIRVIMPSVASQAMASGAPSLVTALQGVHL
jgi:hypothetical protein